MLWNFVWNKDKPPTTITTTTTPASTTTRFTGTCKFKVVFENENSLLVVREPDLEATIGITIESSNSACVLQSSVTVRVSTQKYTASENLDYTGSNPIF